MHATSLISAQGKLNFVMGMALAFDAGFLRTMVVEGPTMIGLVPGHISLKGWRVAVLLCTSAWLGLVPDDVALAPPVAVARRGGR